MDTDRLKQYFRSPPPSTAADRSETYGNAIKVELFSTLTAFPSVAALSAALCERSMQNACCRLWARRDSPLAARRENAEAHSRLSHINVMYFITIISKLSVMGVGQKTLFLDGDRKKRKSSTRRDETQIIVKRVLCGLANVTTSRRRDLFSSTTSITTGYDVTYTRQQRQRPTADRRSPGKGRGGLRSR